MNERLQKVNKQKMEIVRLHKKYPKITTADIAKMLDMPESTVVYYKRGLGIGRNRLKENKDHQKKIKDLLCRAWK